MATLPFYRQDLEPQKGQKRFAADSPKIYRRPAIDLCMEYCRENGIEPREHAICYEHRFPAWLSGMTAEEVKAELEQIIYWNLVDGYAYVENPTPEKIACQQGDMTIGENVYYGGLLRFDMMPKPAYNTIRDLFGKVWHTETEGATNENGEIRFRGFFGEYEVGACGTAATVNCKKAVPTTEDRTRKITVKVG